MAEIATGMKALMNFPHLGRVQGQYYIQLLIQERDGDNLIPKFYSGRGRGFGEIPSLFPHFYF